jgi:hypothetical protein
MTDVKVAEMDDNFSTTGATVSFCSMEEYLYLFIVC